MTASQNPPIVIDNGTGYTKMGYAGNTMPSYVIPTAVASDEKAVSGARDKLDDLDFYIGDEVRGATWLQPAAPRFALAACW